ncbi:MAG: flagellar biosynthetic protein FliQ [Rhodospirillaceae bacterium]|nr:MAG: flagellar biosynthetic protein FliQ [Rhodospirillaceae bacterium]
MNETDVLDIAREALMVVLKTSAPVMLIGMGVGLTIALFQALTTIQEMTLTFVPKIVAIFITIVLFLPFMMTTVIEFSISLFDRISDVG